MSKITSYTFVALAVFSGLSLLLIILYAGLLATSRMDSSDDLSAGLITLDARVGFVSGLAAMVLSFSIAILRTGSWPKSLRWGLACFALALVLLTGGLWAAHSLQLDSRGGNSAEEFRIWWSKPWRLRAGD